MKTSTLVLSLLFGSSVEGASLEQQKHRHHHHHQPAHLSQDAPNVRFAKKVDNSIRKSEIDFEGQLERSLAAEKAKDFEQDSKFMENSDKAPAMDPETKEKLDRWRAEDEAIDREL